MTDMRFLRTFALTMSLLGTTDAIADDTCEATALRDVPALEAPTAIIRKGQLDTAITQFRVDKRNGDTSFCSHGGYCYPTHMKVGGDKLQALRMKNCTVDAQGKEEKGDDYVVYAVTSLPPKTSQTEHPMVAHGTDAPAEASKEDATRQATRLPPAPPRTEYGSQDIPMLLAHQDGDEFVSKFLGHTFSAVGSFVSFEDANLPTTSSMRMASVMTAGGQVVCLFNRDSGITSMPYSRGDPVSISGQLAIALPTVLALSINCSILPK